MLPAAAIETDFRIVSDEGGALWFEETRTGKRFLSRGVNHVAETTERSRPGTEYYDAANAHFGGDVEAWKRATLERLADAGFNTIGCWSSPALHGVEGFYETPILYAAGHHERRVFESLAPDFEEAARARIREAVAQRPDPSRIIGWFLDNEPSFWGEGHWAPQQTYTLLEEAFDRAPDDSARKAAIDFLKRRFPSYEWFAGAWGLDIAGKFETLKGRELATGYNIETQETRAKFAAFVAEAYFGALSRAFRAEATGKLNLGVRFAGEPPLSVLEVCGQWCDVISFNAYSGSPVAPMDRLARGWLVGRKPMMITEYTFRGKENSSGCPNTVGVAAVFDTQADRARNAGLLTRDIYRHPQVLGAHWFEFADQSPQGRFDGENSNYGIVDIHDRPYVEMFAELNAANKASDDLHTREAHPTPSTYPIENEIMFVPGPIADKPLQVDLLSQEAALPPEVHLTGGGASATLKHDEQGWVIDYDAGTARGFHVLFAGPRSLQVSNAPVGATDLNGYTRILLDAEIPEGTEFKIYLYEGGVAPPWQKEYDLRGGDEGQAFETNLFIAKSGRRRITYGLDQLIPQTRWGWLYGNQGGSHRVHLKSVRGLCLALIGGQGAGTIRLRGLKLYRG